MSVSILVIDDDATVRTSTVAYLDDCDYRVFEANSGAAGLAVIERESINAVVCDLKMPGMYGIELLERIKAQQPQLPVLIVSGAGVMDDVVRALRLGADDFLVKPIIDFEVLKYALDKALDRVRLEQENARYRANLEISNRDLKEGLEELRNDQLAGRQAQLRMLPEPLNFQGLICRHKILPSLLLSGDFLDYFEVDEHRLAFYIADVSGHGASSAFVTVLLKNHTYRLRRHLQKGTGDELLQPELVLQRLNQELLASGLEKHLTIVCGILCTQTSQLIYSVGGHLPLPILRTDQGVEYLPGSGMPVGLFEEAVYQRMSVDLPDNFSLHLFSDGILEVMNSSDLEHKEALLLQACQSSKEDIASLMSRFELEDGSEVPDDIAMMCISRSKK